MSETRSLRELTDALDDRQQKAVEMLVENEFNRALGNTTITEKEIAEEIGVSRQTLSRWKKLPAFIEFTAYHSKLQTDMLRPLADSQLAKLIKGTSNNGIPSIKSLELYYKISGVLVERREQTYVDGNKPTLSQEQIERGIEDLAERLRTARSK